MIAAWLLSKGVPAWLQELLRDMVLAAALLGALWWAYHRIDKGGYDRAVAERKADDDAALRIAGAQAYTDEKALSDKFLLAQRDRFKENHDAQATIDYWRGRVQSGAAVLRLPSDSIRPVAEGRDSAVAGGLVGGAGPDLMPSFSGDILGIAGAIAAGVRRQNALIATYNDARATCNKK